MKSNIICKLVGHDLCPLGLLGEKPRRDICLRCLTMLRDEEEAGRERKTREELPWQKKPYVRQVFTLREVEWYNAAAL